MCVCVWVTKKEVKLKDERKRDRHTIIGEKGDDEQRERSHCVCVYVRLLRA